MPELKWPLTLVRHSSIEGRFGSINFVVFTGANGDDIVLLDNASAAVNVILRSFILSPGDQILQLSFEYGNNTPQHRTTHILLMVSVL